MRKVLIHREIIPKSGAKRSFQIMLPKNARMCSGILIEATKTSLSTETHLSNKFRYAGWATLQIPSERDVFYSALIPFTNSETFNYSPIGGIGMDGQNQKWFSAEQNDFFSVCVPIKSTLIEGYYEDHALGADYPYELKIYLRIEQKTEEKNN